MNPAITIRHADPISDRDFLKEMLRGLYLDQCAKEDLDGNRYAKAIYKSTDILTEALLRGSGICFIAYLNNKPAGFIYKTDTEIGSGVFLTPEARNRGVFNALAQTCTEQLSADNNLSLRVLTSNHRAIKLYKKFGFEADPESSDDRVLVMVRASALEASLA